MTPSQRLDLQRLLTACAEHVNDPILRAKIQVAKNDLASPLFTGWPHMDDPPKVARKEVRA